MGVQRAAARLRRRRVDLASVREERVSGVSVDVREDEILHAACQKCHARPPTARRLFLPRNERVGEGRRNRWCLGLEPSKIRREEARQSGSPDRRLQSAPLVEPQCPAGGSQRTGTHEQETQRHGAPETTLEGAADPGGLDVASRRFE